jgi:hypothetical protein
MKKPTKIKQFIDQNPIEQLLSIGKGAASDLVDVGKKAVSADSLDMLRGLEIKDTKNSSGDLTEGQELDLKALQQAELEAQESKANIEAAMNYHQDIVRTGERLVTKETQEIDMQLQEIMMEIKKLADSSKELQMQFKEVAIEQHTQKPGKYHKSFFTWLFSVVRSARMKVEDSGAWLTAMQSKKKYRQYGEMAKKHGTTFTLSSERNVATQVG